MLLDLYKHIRGISGSAPCRLWGSEHVVGDMFESVPSGDAVLMKVGWILLAHKKINPRFTLQYEMCPTPADANDATIYPSLIDTLFIIWWIYTVSRNAIPKEEWIVGVQLLAGFFSKKNPVKQI